MIIKRIIQTLLTFIGCVLGYFYGPSFFGVTNIFPTWVYEPMTGAVLGGLIFFIFSLWLADLIVEFFKLIEERIVRAPVANLLFGTLGLIIGLIVAFFSQLPLSALNLPLINMFLIPLITIFLGYLGFQVGFRKRDELMSIFSFQGKMQQKDKSIKQEEEGRRLKILDTSVIIDGRIADICQTGFLEGVLVIPQFVLEELQHIADSSDALKRNRGRRGLDILNKIQKELDIPVEIYEGDFEDIQEVDSKLVKLAKLTSGVVVTNDFNLNKVCELQKVAVLNINDLANAVKPVVLPGEELNVQVIKDGKEHNQGVAYLDDGTMIVVEEGRNYIGQTIDVIVTSVLQTSAGRMIFAKPKPIEKAL